MINLSCFQWSCQYNNVIKRIIGAMILTCPQCQTRFLVPSAALPDEGRKVRCCQCRHIWLQMPVDDVTDLEIPQKTEKKEDGVKIETPSPDAKPDNVGQPIEQASVTKEKKQVLSLFGNSTSIGTKAFISGLFLVLLPFLLYRWMAPELVVGYGLVFHDVQIERDGDGLAIYGEIVNTMNDERGVPPVRMTMIHSGVNGDSVLFTPDRDIIAGGASIPIAYTIPDIETDVTDLKISFDMPDSEKEDAGEGEWPSADIPSSTHP